MCSGQIRLRNCSQVQEPGRELARSRQGKKVGDRSGKAIRVPSKEIAARYGWYVLPVTGWLVSLRSCSCRTAGEVSCDGWWDDAPLSAELLGSCRFRLSSPLSGSGCVCRQGLWLRRGLA